MLEVGLGGRGDATNVIEHPAACGDHLACRWTISEMLGDTIAIIAKEKGGHH